MVALNDIERPSKVSFLSPARTISDNVREPDVGTKAKTRCPRDEQTGKKTNRVKYTFDDTLFE